MAPFKFIERVFNGIPIQQYGDGNTSRDYTYIDDIVDGVVAAIDKPLGCEVQRQSCWILAQYNELMWLFFSSFPGCKLGQRPTFLAERFHFSGGEGRGQRG